jgi:hypothetical protein
LISLRPSTNITSDRRARLVCGVRAPLVEQIAQGIGASSFVVV